MNIGIIVYSQTGNTLSVAQRLEEALLKAGHFVQLERVTVESTKKLSKGMRLESRMDLNDYDMLFFGSPVHAFALASPMSVYLSNLSSLKRKKVGVFVTQGLKYAWMGGNRSVSQMKKLCLQKGAEVFATGVVGWSSGSREKQIQDVVERFCRG